MTKKQEFIDTYKKYIKREGSLELLEFLSSSKSDFFDAPCSTKYHLSKEGGLVEHSLNVYECLKAYLERPRVKELYGLSYAK